MTESKIGLALSGGGFRATAFGLGCLRALHDRDLLRSVSVVSGVSGGSLLAALYAYGPVDFAEFDALVVEQLRRGLQLETAMRALRPLPLVRNLITAATLMVRRGGDEPALKGGSRTDALRDTLAARVFGDRDLTAVTHPELATVITATDLRTSNAMRFGSTRSACSAYGVAQEPILVAEAVAASGAFPFVLPTAERQYTFADRDGGLTSHVVALSDGGIYDNLGLSVLAPGRSTLHTPHVYNVDYIVVSDAGRGRLALGMPRLFGSRLKRSFDVAYRRAQDGTRALLHAAGANGLYRGVVHPYLGMPDERLPVPVADLVPAGSVRHFPTNFRSMSDAEVHTLTLRGEQLTRTLLSHYCGLLV